MNREELLKIAKPILFSTPMVQAILEGRKTVARRIVKPQLPENVIKICEIDPNGYLNFKTADRLLDGWGNRKAPYKVGDILYVRETWGNWSYDNPESNAVYYQYKADYPSGAKTYMYDETHECDLPKWHPSIHMPKDAARIFLKVTDVRVERLQDITIDGVEQEGIPLVYPIKDMIDSEHLKKFIAIWNSAIRKQDLDCYGWEANPWVWVIEFERVEVQ